MLQKPGHLILGLLISFTGDWVFLGLIGWLMGIGEMKTHVIYYILRFHICFNYIPGAFLGCSGENGRCILLHNAVACGYTEFTFVFT